MSKTIDLTGQQFSRLTVICEDGRVSKHVAWKCQCACGNVVRASGANLRRGHTRSCGCLHKERIGAFNRTHGMTDTSTYKSWQAMHARCSNANDPNYPRYGAVGITVCPEWSSFERFLSDVGERPLGTSLDRYPNHTGNYEPGNCRWATRQQQSENRKSTVWVSVDGETMPLKRAAKHFGVNYDTVRDRLERGWPLEDALKKPSGG